MREFLWSEDMADASVFMLENVDFADVRGTDPQVRNCHVNIGTGKDLSIKELACKIAAATGFGGNILWDSSKPDGTMLKLCDVSKLHRLGWHHTVEIDEGVKRLYDWYVASDRPRRISNV